MTETDRQRDRQRQTHKHTDTQRQTDRQTERRCRKPILGVLPIVNLAIHSFIQTFSFRRRPDGVDGRQEPFQGPARHRLRISRALRILQGQRGLQSFALGVRTLTRGPNRPQVGPHRRLDGRGASTPRGQNCTCTRAPVSQATDGGQGDTDLAPGGLRTQ